MKSKGKRWLIWALTGAVLTALIVWALWPRPQLADFAAVTRGPLVVTLDEEGETRVRDRFVVSAPLIGRVLRIELEPGDSVGADDTVLATFQPQSPALLDARSRAEAVAAERAERAALERSRAESDRAAAELDFARAELERIRKLAAEEIVSKERLEAAELDERSKKEAWNAAKYAVDTARHRLAVARARLSDGDASGDATAPIRLRSPIDGVVLRRLRESETIVAAGEPLLEVGDPTALEIVADYLSADAVRIHPGARVEIDSWGGERPLAGRVRVVEPSGFTKISALGVEEQRVNVIIDLTDPAAEWRGLADGYRVEVRVVIWEDDDVLQVPIGSLFRHAEGWALFVVEDGQARLRQVRPGHRGERTVEIVEGVEDGATVIVYPSDTLADGVAVAAR